MNSFEGVRGSYNRRKKAKEYVRQEHEKRYDDLSLDKLKQDIRTHCKTIFVGAVAKIEKYFGMLWNDNEGLDESDMTEEQKDWFYAFLDAREEIFDQGNDQLSKLLNRIDEYHVRWNRRNYQFSRNHKDDRE